MMRAAVRQRLLTINRTFYQRFASSFSQTRFGAQPGWHLIIPHFPSEGTILDVGCGNGRFALFLAAQSRGASASWQYVGVDFSRPLLLAAREKAQAIPWLPATFVQGDLAQTPWPLASATFESVVAWAVLHHIPGFTHRVAFLREARRAMKPGAALFLSTWRFTHNPRMRRKILPWSRAGLSEADVEPGDYLLDWKKEGMGMRYAHEITPEELEALAQAAGFRVQQTWVADGREGDLSLYAILTP